MHGRPSAAHIVIIDQIVVHERPCMEHLDCCGGGQHGIFISADGPARPHQHGGPQSLGGPFYVRKNRVRQVLWFEPGPKTRLLEVVADKLLPRLERGHKINRHMRLPIDTLPPVVCQS